MNRKMREFEDPTPDSNLFTNLSLMPWRGQAQVVRLSRGSSRPTPSFTELTGNQATVGHMCTDHIRRRPVPGLLNFQSIVEPFPGRNINDLKPRPPRCRCSGQRRWIWVASSAPTRSATTRSARCLPSTRPRGTTIRMEGCRSHRPPRSDPWGLPRPSGCFWLLGRTKRTNADTSTTGKPSAISSATRPSLPAFALRPSSSSPRCTPTRGRHRSGTGVSWARRPGVSSGTSRCHEYATDCRGRGRDEC